MLVFLFEIYIKGEFDDLNIFMRLIHNIGKLFIKFVLIVDS